MKNQFSTKLATFALSVFALASLATALASAQGPSDQPDAPLETGDVQSQGPGGQSMNQQAPPDQAPADQEPGNPSDAETHQGVARISMIHGDVSTQRGDSGDWSAAALNAPVLGGDKVSTGDNARAEVQLDYANVLRLGANSQANITSLADKQIQIQLAKGIATFTVFKDSEAEPEIDTPNVAIHPAHKDGSFRIEVLSEGETVIISRNGEAQVTTEQGSTEIKKGEMITVRGSGQDSKYKTAGAPEKDDWDRWNTERDRIIRSADAWHHTNRYYTGSEDLDANGSWDNVPDYGSVWVPNEPAGWAPYRDGNWVWEPYYGWTWVGSEPWGWAPYHYGRWFPYGASWAWWPGPVGGFGVGLYRPFWSPAYVSFFGFGGFGGGFGFGVGFGRFGWLPIGPCDPFFPWWGGFGRRFGGVNVVNIRVTNINRFGGIRPLHAGTRFSNLSRVNEPRIRAGMSTVGSERFGAGRITGQAASREMMQNARMMTGNLPVVPSRQSLSASGRAAAPSTIHGGESQRFFGNSRNASRPESFDHQTSRLQQSMKQDGHFTPLQAGGRTNGPASVESRNSPGGTSPRGNMQKPSAGTPGGSRENAASTPNSGRDGNNAGARSGVNAPSSRTYPGFRPFTPPNSSNSRPAPGNIRSDRPGNTGSNGSRPSESSPNRGEPNRSEWKPFTPPSHGTAEPAGRGIGGNPGQGSSRGNDSYWNRTAPSSPSESRGAVYGRSDRGSSRPPLDMRQPVVQPRSSGGYPGRSGGYPGSVPNVPRGGGSGGGGYHGTPSGGGSYPSGGASHGSGGGGGGSSHPSSGGSSGGHSSSSSGSNRH
jgi:hypothetical protein